MRKQPLNVVWAIIFMVAGSSLYVQAKTQRYAPSVIYGDDNRQDYFEVADRAWTQRADATVALIRANDLDPAGMITHIKTKSYGQGMGFCPSEPFYEQETAAFCSGFLISPDTIVTAGHCIRSQSTCESTRFVFGFRLNSPSLQPRSVASEHVFRCSRLVHTIANPNGEDFAVVKLDRPVIHVPPLPFRTSGKPAVGDKLVVIGHPAGLPLKIADGAAIRKVMPQHLVSNLDTYGGNSGSAVFNELTGEIEGILVRGEMDFIYQNGCRLSNRCTADGCRGEDVTLFERVLPHL